MKHSALIRKASLNAALIILSLLQLTHIAAADWEKNFEKEHDGPVCYVYLLARETGLLNSHRESSIQISVLNREPVQTETSIILGQEDNISEQAYIRIAGQNFLLAVRQGSAWLVDKKEEPALLEKVRQNIFFEIHFMYSGKLTIDKYHYRAFDKAWNKAISECDVVGSFEKT